MSEQLKKFTAANMILLLLTLSTALFYYRYHISPIPVVFLISLLFLHFRDYISAMFMFNAAIELLALYRYGYSKTADNFII